MTLPRNVIAYYDNEGKDYWIDTVTGWLSLTETALARHLRDDGYGKDNLPGKLITPIDQKIIEFQMTNRVDFAGPIAGWKKGIYDMSGLRVLVTSSPRLWVPKKGEWKLIETCLQRLMAEHPLQYGILISWLSLACKSLYLHDFIPGQILFLIGPRHCGKSFLQSLITWLLGERSGRPWDYLVGRTGFNRDIIGAEHLIIADPEVSSLRDRAAFANKLKQFAAEEEHRCHTKHKDAIMAKPYQRISISANDELHNLNVVPTLEKSFEDKCQVLKCASAAVPPPGYENVSRSDFETQVRSEIPSFLHFLLNEWQIPAELRQKDHCKRFRLDSFQHPELADAINEQSPEILMLNIIDDSQLLANSTWKGSPKALAKDLACLSDPEAQKFARSSWTVARHLSSLHEHFPSRIYQTTRSKTKRPEWVIEKLPSPGN